MSQSGVLRTWIFLSVILVTIFGLLLRYGGMGKSSSVVTSHSLGEKSSEDMAKQLLQKSGMEKLLDTSESRI